MLRQRLRKHRGVMRRHGLAHRRREGTPTGVTGTRSTVAVSGRLTGTPPARSLTTDQPDHERPRDHNRGGDRHKQRHVRGVSPQRRADHRRPRTWPVKLNHGSIYAHDQSFPLAPAPLGRRTAPCCFLVCSPPYQGPGVTLQRLLTGPDFAEAVSADVEP
jgi:hypothetical protein